MEVHDILCGFTRMSVHILGVPYRYLLKDSDDIKRLSTLDTASTYPVPINVHGLVRVPYTVPLKNRLFVPVWVGSHSTHWCHE
jgi:hypothetical protein